MLPFAMADVVGAKLASTHAHREFVGDGERVEIERGLYLTPSNHLTAMASQLSRAPTKRNGGKVCTVSSLSL
jgi:hypothetical protein